MPGPYIDTRSSIVTTKSMTYRGGTKLWSNRYHVTGPETISDAEWNVFADAFVADEAAALSDNLHIVEAVWNDASTATLTNPHGIATHAKTYATAGTVAEAGAIQVPGDCAGVMRFLTDQRSIRNHPIYLFKYLHGIRYSAGTPSDTLGAAWVTAMQEWGQDLLDGISDGTNTRILCSPRGAVAQSRTTLATIRHRDFPT